MNSKLFSLFLFLGTLFSNTPLCAQELFDNEQLEEFQSDSDYNYEEVILPSIWETKTFTDKLGEEKEGQMWTFKDKADRNCCLIPEKKALETKKPEPTPVVQKDPPTSVKKEVATEKKEEKPADEKAAQSEEPTEEIQH